MVNSLEKVIERFILPQFPLIVGCRVVFPFKGNDLDFIVDYLIKTDEDGHFMYKSDDFDDIHNLTDSVCKMMANDDYSFYNTRFSKDIYGYNCWI